MVSEDRRDVVVAGEQPAVVDAVVDEGLVMAEPFQRREGIVDVELGVEVGRLDAASMRAWS